MNLFSRFSPKGATSQKITGSEIEAMLEICRAVCAGETNVSLPEVAPEQPLFPVWAMAQALAAKSRQCDQYEQEMKAVTISRAGCHSWKMRAHPSSN